jgi:peptidoglycan/LPS O-acetylase OafA/YrhL
MAGASRLDSLTGLRFAAAFVVFGLHLETLFYFNAPYGGMTRFFSQGGTGVSFFFVLSGFVLTWSHQQDDTPKAFYQRRFARIVPLHVITWIGAGIVLMVLAQTPSPGPAGFSLALLNPWVPSSSYYVTMNVPSWSLGCEAFFYALFPILYVRLSSLNSHQRRQVLGALIGAIVVIAALTYPAKFGTDSAWFVYYFPPVRLLEFAAGMLLALEVADGRLPTIGLAPAMAFAVAAYAAAGWVPTSFALVAVTVLPFCILIVAAAQRDQSGRRSLWSSKPLVRLGTWSFAFYLVHFPILEVMAHAESKHLGTWGGVANGIAALVICTLAAALVYRFIERPFERMLRPARLPAASEPAVAEAT